MKKLISLLILVFSIINIACKKDVTIISIKGYWTGTAKDDTSAAVVPISFLFKDASLSRGYILDTDTTVSVNGNGTYTIDSDSVRTTILVAGKAIHFSGKLNSSANQMTGKYVNISTSVTGSFSLTKN